MGPEGRRGALLKCIVFGFNGKSLDRLGEKVNLWELKGPIVR